MKRRQGIKPMRIAEIKLAAYKAIGLLQQARPGSTSGSERMAKRMEAGNILESLPKNWWKRLSEKDSEAILTSLGDVA